VTVLFCDLVGSTERQTRIGDDASDDFRRRFFDVLAEAVRRFRGEEVKNTGDGLMVVFRHSALDAVACAVAMHESVGELDADEPVRLYVGISAGEAAEDGGDWFGTPVNEAARLCSAAKPGQTLTNEVVRSLVGSRGAFAFRAVGSLTLKGMPRPVAAVEVVRQLDEPAAVRSGQQQRRRPRRALTIGLAVVVVVAATVAVAVVRNGSHGSGVPAAALRAPAYPVSYIVKPCSAAVLDSIAVPGLECGTLTVPEDRAKPNGRSIRLDAVRAPAREQATSDPVLDFGADNLVTSPARDHSEEIQLARRGANALLQSDPTLTCPEYADIAADALTKPLGDPELEGRNATAIRACYDRWTGAGVDLNQYNHLAAGDDMVDLIRALNLTHVHLVSGYVGTIGALEVIRQLPDVVRTLTLQEPVAPGQSAHTNPAKYLSDAFNNYVSLCQADPACNATFHDLPGEYRRGHDAAGSSPRLVQGDDGNGHAHEVLLDADRVTQALADALNQRETYPLIAAAIDASIDNPVAATAIAGRVIDANAPLLTPDYSWGAALSEQCSYEAHTVDQTSSALTRQALPQFSKFDDQSLLALCSAWPVHEIDQIAFAAPSATVPTLIVTPTLLPGADPQWADIFRRGLPNATVLTFATLDGAILGTGDPPCLAAIRRAFLTDPTKAIDSAACEGQTPPIHFLASLGG
jgi:class 3 adenylate cyclase/pimeloyl-ACP methyl ester carboxylesterase